MSQKKIILIAGPTASGKTSLAIELAQKANGTIINADAMQVYEGLLILSAQPTTAQRQMVPHELYGVLDPTEASSAGKWLGLAQQAIDKTIATGRVPILVGGTGLYFRALLGGLAEIPPIPDEARQDAIALYDKIGEDEFRARLAKIDAHSAKSLARNDRQRLIRAYEVAQHTGRPLSEWHQSGKQNHDYDYEKHLLLPERNALYAACDKRFAAMVEQGAVEETRAFLAHKLDPALPAMKTIGLREIGASLEGEMTLAEAVTKAQQATRNYAKRQMTWFRNQGLGAPM